MPFIHNEDKNHEKHSHHQNNNYKKYIIIIVIFILIFFMVLIVSSFYPKIKTINEQKDSSLISSEEIINTNEEIVKNRTVENAEYLEVAGLEIKYQNGYSSIKTTIKNNSEETLKNFSITISIFDNDGNIVTELSNPIECISPNETIESFGIVNSDISNTTNYIVKKN